MIFFIKNINIKKTLSDESMSYFSRFYIRFSLTHNFVYTCITISFLELLSSFYIKGGVFEPDFENLELVMRYAINRVNQRRDLLPITALNANVQSTPMDDSFVTSRKGS